MKADQWISLFFAMNLTGIIQNIAANCVLESVKGNNIQLLLSENQTAIYNDAHKGRIQQALTDYFGEEIVLSINVGSNQSETPASYRLRKEQEALQVAVANFKDDANVKEIIRRFGGIIQIDSIKTTSN